MTDAYEIMDRYHIDLYDLPDREYVQVGVIGNEVCPRPKLTQENLEYIIEKHNELVAFIAERLEV